MIETRKLKIDEETLAFDEIDNSVIEEAVENLSEDLEKAHPKSLLIKLRNAGLLKNWFPCACHTAQLAVKDLLARNLGHRSQVNVLVAKAHEYVKCCKNSTKCAEIFLNERMSLVSMNKTRWNSMYNMLNSLLKADDRNILEQLPPLSCQPPKNFEMNILREVCEIIQPISLFTNEMQATHAQVA